MRVRSHSVDLIPAAGSLNYVDLNAFFPEARRVLVPQGLLVVYDFSPGRSFDGETSLDEWFRDFCLRYPYPPNEAAALTPAVLGPLATGFQMQAQDNFEIGLRLTLGFYVNYMLTETNVAAAVRRGVPVSEIRSWCEKTLPGVWNGRERDVLFRGYFACLVPVP